MGSEHGFCRDRVCFDDNRLKSAALTANFEALRNIQELRIELIGPRFVTTQHRAMSCSWLRHCNFRISSRLPSSTESSFYFAFRV
jgi:hypothetical protein